MSSEKSGTITGKGSSSKAYNNGDKWVVDVSGGQIFFSNSPENISDIIVDTNLSLSSYYQKPLYIVSDNNLIGNEIALSLEKYVSRVQNACYGNCTSNYPEKDCKDNLIVYNSTKEKRVYQKENCVFINGDLRALDAFLYKIFGV